MTSGPLYANEVLLLLLLLLRPAGIQILGKYYEFFYASSIDLFAVHFLFESKMKKDEQRNELIVSNCFSLHFVVIVGLRGAHGGGRPFAFGVDDCRHQRHLGT